MQSHLGMPYHTIKITHRESGKEMLIKLYSHYTCITGESGIGKTFFFEMLRENSVFNIYEIESDFPITYVDDDNILETVLEVPQRRIIFIDETIAFSRQGSLMRKLNSSQHLILCIGRGLTCKGDYPLQGIYRLEMDKDYEDWFTIHPVFDLNASFQINDRIVTEAGDGKSEHYIISRTHAAIPACGRNNVSKCLLNTETTTCFIDLGNIGRAYSLLAKRIEGQNHNVFDYQSFEQLVYESDLVHGSRDVDSFAYTTIEMMYEKLLERENIGYKHSKPLCDNIKAACENGKIYTGVLGKALQGKYNDKPTHVNAF